MQNGSKKHIESLRAQGCNYFPRLKSGERIGIKLAQGTKTPGVVRDELTGQIYRVRRASCGLQCRCDAVATPVGIIRVLKEHEEHHSHRIRRAFRVKRTQKLEVQG